VFRIPICVPALAISVIGASAQALQIAADGKATCAIVISDAAAPSEQTAANELAEYLKKATGASFAIRKETDSPAEGAQILVGPSSRAKSAAGSVDFDALGTEGIVMKLAGQQLVLAGGRPRGTLYAVDTFLEDV